MKNSELLLIGLAILSGSMGAIFLKIGSTLLIYDENIYTFFISIIKNWILILGFLMYLIPTAIIIYLLRSLELSLLQPLLSLTYVITPILAFYILKENINPLRIIGISLIILGVIFIGKS